MTAMWVAAVARHIASHVPEVVFDETGVDGNLFISTMPSTPDLAVMLHPAGGMQQADLTPERIPTPQLLVRSIPHDPRPGFALATAILDVLDGLGAGVLDPDGEHLDIVGCTALQSAPVSIGVDSNDRHEWSMNFVLSIWTPSALRPQ